VSLKKPVAGRGALARADRLPVNANNFVDKQERRAVRDCGFDIRKYSVLVA